MGPSSILSRGLGVVLVVLVALGLLIAPAGAQYADPPTITVTPVGPGPGDPVTVTVTGCGRAEGEVIITIDGVEVGRVIPDADGNFSVDVLVPELAGGSVSVDVTCDSGVLSSVITVVVGDQPFQDDDDDAAGGAAPLPRTGSDMPGLLARFGAVLLGSGALLVIIAGRRRGDVDAPAHAA